MRLNLDQIQGILRADFRTASNMQNTEILSVCRDTNDVTAQSLFVCIAGQRFDGHDFAKKAVQAGASALLVTRHLVDIDVPQFIVSDAVKALGILANAWRKKFKGKVIAITGTAGKTTLKECLAHVLASAGKKVARNKLNYNNQIGLPLSMLSASGNEDYWVMEAGISQPHDMDELGSILEPDMALVLNAGNAHTEGLGAKGVAWHKAQLLKYIKPDNSAMPQAFVCADYAELVQHAKAICPEAYLFSGQELGLSAECKATYLGMGEGADGAKGKYSVSYAQKSFEISTPFYGSYGAENIAAIVSIAHNLGLGEQEIINGIQSVSLPEQRFNMHELGAWCIIDDSYNANALSMQKMLEAAVQKSGNAPCYAVLGAMGELGNVATQEHENLGHNLANLGIKNVFWKGPHAHDVLKGLEAENHAGKFIIVNDASDFGAKWHEAKLSPGTVLCKGSRSNALDEFVSIILHQIKTEQGNSRGDYAV